MTKHIRVLIGYDGSECAEAARGPAGKCRSSNSSIAERGLPPPPASGYDMVEKARQVKVPADLEPVYSKDSKALRDALQWPNGYWSSQRKFSRSVIK